MTPVDQEFLSNKEAGVIGDCVRAATASLLDLPIAHVPHFVALYDHDWSCKWEDWLAELGVEPVKLSAGKNYYSAPEVFHLAAGTTIRGTRHMVVRLGDTLAHDPHPSRDGLEEIDTVWVLVPKDIGKAMRLGRSAASAKPLSQPAKDEI